MTCNGTTDSRHSQVSWGTESFVVTSESATMEPLSPGDEESTALQEISPNSPLLETGDHLEPEPEVGETEAKVEEEEEEEESDGVPYDRGWAWMLVLGLFINFTLLSGYLKSSGLLFVELLHRFNAPTTHTSLLFTIRAAVFSVCGLYVMNVFLGKFGSRKLVLAGGVLMALSAILSSLANELTLLIFIHSLLLAMAMAMLISPGEVLLGTYFRKRRSLALSLAKCGASVGNIAVPPLISYFLETYGLSGTLLLYGGICLFSLPAGMLFRPMSFYRNRHKKRQRLMAQAQDDDEVELDKYEVELDKDALDKDDEVELDKVQLDKHALDNDDNFVSEVNANFKNPKVDCEGNVLEEQGYNSIIVVKEVDSNCKNRKVDCEGNVLEENDSKLEGVEKFDDSTAKNCNETTMGSKCEDRNTDVRNTLLGNTLTDHRNTSSDDKGVSSSNDRTTSPDSRITSLHERNPLTDVAKTRSREVIVTSHPVTSHPVSGAVENCIDSDLPTHSVAKTVVEEKVGHVLTPHECDTTGQRVSSEQEATSSAAGVPTFSEDLNTTPTYLHKARSEVQSPTQQTNDIGNIVSESTLQHLKRKTKPALPTSGPRSELINSKHFDTLEGDLAALVRSSPDLQSLPSTLSQTSRQRTYSYSVQSPRASTVREPNTPLRELHHGAVPLIARQHSYQPGTSTKSSGFDVTDRGFSHGSVLKFLTVSEVDLAATSMLTLPTTETGSSTPRRRHDRTRSGSLLNDDHFRLDDPDLTVYVEEIETPEQGDGKRDQKPSCGRRVLRCLLFCPKKLVFMLDFRLFRSPLFRLLLLYFTTSPFVNISLDYLPALASEKGVSEHQAALLVSLVGGLDLVCRLCCGFFADLRIISVPHMIIITFCILAVVVQFVSFLTSFNHFLILAVLQGLFGGVANCLAPVLIIEFVGLDNMGKAIGFCQLVSGASMAVVYPILGYLKDVTGHYSSMYHVIGCGMLVSAGMLCLEGLVRRWEKKSISKNVLEETEIVIPDAKDAKTTEDGRS